MNEKTKSDELQQGFNDEELADIMSEIENLEKEFIGDEKVEETPASCSTEDLKISPIEVEEKKTDLQAEIDSEMESLLSEMGPIETKIEQAPVVKPALEVPKVEEASDPMSEIIASVEETKKEQTPVIEEKIMDNNVVALKEVGTEQKKPENQTQLDFSVSGQMSLKLKFTVNGQTVGLVVNETEGLIIEMMGGARFSLPMSEALAKKKAA